MEYIILIDDAADMRRVEDSGIINMEHVKQRDSFEGYFYPCPIHIENDIITRWGMVGSTIFDYTVDHWLTLVDQYHLERNMGILSREPSP